MRALVLLATLLVVSGSIQATTDPDCGALDKTCKDMLEPPGNEPPQDDYWLRLVKPYVDRDTYALLQTAWPDGGVPPPLPVPQRPEANLTASLNGTVTIFGKELHVNRQVQAQRYSSSDQPGRIVPCQDLRGCPDLTIDSSRLLVGLLTTETITEDSCNVLEGSAAPGNRRLLRFTTTVPNLGDGDLIIGAPEAHPDWFEWGECHEHWHFQDYSDYRLWDPDTYVDWLQIRQDNPDTPPDELIASNATLAAGFVAGHKQGFCVIDIRPYLLIEPPKYQYCGFSQGVSRGWADEYNFLLDGQFIDVTDLEPGPYVLEVEANPRRFYEEIDYGNNAGQVLVFIP